MFVVTFILGSELFKFNVEGRVGVRFSFIHRENKYLTMYMDTYFRVSTRITLLNRSEAFVYSSKGKCREGRVVNRPT